MNKRLTNAQHKAKATADIVKAREDRERKHAAETTIMDALPDSLEYHMVHASPLYGRAGSVHLASDFSGDYETHYTLAQVGELLEQFPPVAAEFVRDGCVSFRVAGWVQTGALADRPTAERTPVLGVVVEVDKERARVKWYSQVTPGLCLEFVAPLRMDEAPGRLNVKYRRDRRTERPLELLSSSLESYRFAWGTFDKIRYGGGGDLDPGTSVMYFTTEKHGEDLKAKGPRAWWAALDTRNAKPA